MISIDRYFAFKLSQEAACSAAIMFLSYFSRAFHWYNEIINGSHTLLFITFMTSKSHCEIWSAWYIALFYLSLSLSYRVLVQLAIVDYVRAFIAHNSIWRLTDASSSCDESNNGDLFSRSIKEWTQSYVGLIEHFYLDSVAHILNHHKACRVLSYRSR